MKPAAVLAVVAIVASTSLSACSAGDQKAAAGQAEVTAGISAAKTALAPLLDTPSDLTLDPLSAPPPAGKTLTFVSCPTVSCANVQTGVEQAVKAIGWKLRLVNGGLTPESYTSAMDTVASNPGDGVIAFGVLPNDAVSNQLASLRKAGVPFVGIASPSATGADMAASFGSSKEGAISATAMANWITEDSKGKGKVIFYWDESYPVHAATEKAMRKTLADHCPNCTLQVKNISYSGIGSKIPQQVVSDVQSNPGTTYVAFTLGNASAGVGPALAAAGLSDVKIVTRVAGPANLSAIKSGSETAGITVETDELGWRVVDFFARTFVGDPVIANPVGTIHVITKADLPADVSVPFSVTNFRDDFESAWGLR